MTNLNKSFTSSNAIKRVLNAFKYSKQGLKSAYSTEQAFRQDLLLVFLNTVAGFVFLSSPLKLFLVLSFGIFVLIAELVNTAIEYVVDRISTEKHELSGKAKDVGSAIVLLAILNLSLCWIFCLF